MLREVFRFRDFVCVKSTSLVTSNFRVNKFSNFVCWIFESSDFWILNNSRSHRSTIHSFIIRLWIGSYLFVFDLLMFEFFSNWSMKKNNLIFNINTIDKKIVIFVFHFQEFYIIDHKWVRELLFKKILQIIQIIITTNFRSTKFYTSILRIIKTFSTKIK